MTAKPTHVVEIYTDGACKGNPGVGGWGVSLSRLVGGRAAGGLGMGGGGRG